MPPLYYTTDLNASMNNQHIRVVKPAANIATNTRQAMNFNRLLTSLKTLYILNPTSICKATCFA